MKPTIALVACVAMVCVTVLELYALHLGHDGAILLSAVGSIFGFAGLAIGIKVAGR